MATMHERVRGTKPDGRSFSATGGLRSRVPLAPYAHRAGEALMRTLRYGVRYRMIRRSPFPLRRSVSA